MNKKDIDEMVNVSQQLKMLRQTGILTRKNT